jgi:hypothetical protein
MSKAIEKMKIIWEHLEKDFNCGDPFAFWHAVYAYVEIEKNVRGGGDLSYPLPEWILKELGRISDEMIELDTEGRYSQVLANILKIDGNKKKTAAKKRRDAGIRRAARELLQQEGRRKENLKILNKRFGLNGRDIETIYDDVHQQLRSKEKNSKDRP